MRRVGVFLLVVGASMAGVWALLLATGAIGYTAINAAGYDAESGDPAPGDGALELRRSAVRTGPGEQRPGR